jgi:cytochrome P450 family 6/cytochrome P450 family 28
MTAYAMTFFFDGYETSSIAISYILYELAIHPDIQTRLREEVQKAFPDLDKINFEDLYNHPYLDAVVCGKHESSSFM